MSMPIRVIAVTALAAVLLGVLAIASSQFREHEKLATPVELPTAVVAK